MILMLFPILRTSNQSFSTIPDAAKDPRRLLEAGGRTRYRVYLGTLHLALGYTRLVTFFLLLFFLRVFDL